MHIGWLAGHLRRGVHALGVGARAARTPPARSSARSASRRNTARPARASRSPRPRTSSAPCSATTARSASRCSAAQPAGSPAASPAASAGRRAAGPRRADRRRTTCRSPLLRSRSLRRLCTRRGRRRIVRASRPSSSPARSASTGWLDDVLEGHRPVQGDRQLHRRQRRAAPVEEVVAPADLVRAGRRAPPPRRPPAAARSACCGAVILPVDAELRRPARSAPSGRSCCSRSAAGVSRQWNAAGTMYSGSDAASRSRRSLGARAAAGRSRRPPVLAAVRAARRRPPRRRGRPGTRSRVFSISPISIRKPRILTWVSRRPRNSSLPSGRQRP